MKFDLDTKLNLDKISQNFDNFYKLDYSFILSQQRYQYIQNLNIIFDVIICNI